jgi:hypothetical protein
LPGSGSHGFSDPYLPCSSFCHKRGQTVQSQAGQENS